MSIVKRSWFVTGATGLALTGFVWLATACDTGTGDANSDATSELAATADDLSAAGDSLAAAQSATDACLDTFRACRETAGSADESCRDALKDCLPSEAPAPENCSEDDRDRRSRHDADAAANRALPPLGVDGGITHRDEHGEANARAGSRDHARGDGGSRSDADGPGGGRGMGAPRACRKPSIERDGMGSCHDRAADELSHGGEPGAACAAHKRCVADTFGEHMSKLCQKAAGPCASASAPADVCARIVETCSGFANSGS